MKVVYLKNFRRGLATNSSSTHSVVYKNKGEILEDLDIFELNFYDRCDSTIAATKSAKIKYILACIYWDEPLTRVMSERYPEMKKYFPLIKKKMEKCDDDDYDTFSDREYEFGMYNRDSLTVGHNLEFNIDYLTNIIEDDDIVIIGGSDEMDFFYDTVKGHVTAPMPSSIEYNNNKVVKNGNYWVAFGHTDDELVTNYHHPMKNSFRGRLRFSTSKDDPIPEFPELIDLRITNKCQHGCKFCFMDSKMTKSHAKISTIVHILSQLRDRQIEFSIGGGNILLHPHLDKILTMIKEGGHIVNVTVNVKDCETILTNKKFLNLFVKCVDGIGISITEPDDVQIVNDFRDKIYDEVGEYNRKRAIYNYYSKHIVMHIIPEYLGIENTKEILKKSGYGNVLMLGYKTNGRGATQKYNTFTDDELTEMCSCKATLSCDTTFANRYKGWLDKNYCCATTVTWNEGEYSMYIDGVTGYAYKSSYQLDKAYLVKWIPSKYEKCTSIKEAFSDIRRDGGFPVWDEVEKHYWNEHE
jgi:MoaA/NifB/PqqE/SkfB family radical SAM enzyme